MPRNGLTDITNDIRRHPSFPEAARRYFPEYLDWRERLGVLNKVISSAPRVRVIENVLNLHFASVESGGGGGVSFERLVEVSFATDDVGARAVRTVMRLAQTSGLVVSGRDAEDGRLRVYRPTPALIGHARDQTIVNLRPLDAVFPHLQVGERLVSDPEFFGVIGARAGNLFLQKGLRRPGIAIPFRNLMRQEGAAPIISVVIDSHYNGRNVPTAPELTRRFLVSQSQARAVLRNAEALGLVRFGPRGRLLDAEPLAQAMVEGYAQFLAFSAHHIFGVEPPAEA